MRDDLVVLEAVVTATSSLTSVNADAAQTWLNIVLATIAKTFDCFWG